VLAQLVPRMLRAARRNRFPWTSAAYIFNNKLATRFRVQKVLYRTLSDIDEKGLPQENSPITATFH